MKGKEFSRINFVKCLDMDFIYHKWSLTICDGCFDTSKSSKMRSKASDKRCC